MVHNFGTFGAVLTYDVFDFGKRRAEIRQREAQLAEAQENVERLKDAVGVQVERSYNKAERTKKMLQVAAQVVKAAYRGGTACGKPVDPWHRPRFRTAAGVVGQL